jgi:hypothetical protein
MPPLTLSVAPSIVCIQGSRPVDCGMSVRDFPYSFSGGCYRVLRIPHAVFHRVIYKRRVQ